MRALILALFLSSPAWGQDCPGGVCSRPVKTTVVPSSHLSTVRMPVAVPVPQVMPAGVKPVKQVGPIRQWLGKVFGRRCG